jgi:hypothetical protein
MAANETGLCEEVAFGIQLFQNPMPLIIDLLLNLLFQPLFCKTHVVLIS